MPVFTQQVVTPAIYNALAVAYQPAGLIGDALLTKIPNAAPVGIYRIRNKEAMLATVDDRLGEYGVPEELNVGYKPAGWLCTPHGLKTPLSVRAIKNADASIDLEKDAVMQLKAVRSLNKEAEVAGLLTNSANYASGYSTALSGTAQWSDYTNSDPIVAIEAARKIIWRSPTARLVAYAGYDVWSQLKNHPKILARISGGATAGMPAFAVRKMFAELIEVDDFVVGEVRAGTYTGAAIATYNRVWGKNFGIVAVEQTVNPDFLGFAGRFVEQDPEITMWEDIEPGLKGARIMKIAESYAQVTAANDAGILFQTAVA